MAGHSLLDGLVRRDPDPDDRRSTLVRITPAGPDSTHHHLSGLDAILGIVTGVDMISELYGETEATLVYDVHTSVPAIGTQRTAEHLRRADGRIDTIRLIFDATPWHAGMQASTRP
ncbi:hypothetical protein GCM10010260_59850 [Streptomyces filipinensis]|uniref:Uncharacterized protein n=1 Tax=Streptomyces filipinensis TaxID=66887 RepID=A0A918IHB3_9ACTN|nr:hypothetical protein [Streptomyces filipinensis]GGV12992.1 hypothetical protein GCM10010260_59850 [Streptomyces filipinensis]